MLNVNQNEINFGIRAAEASSQNEDQITTLGGAVKPLGKLSISSTQQNSCQIYSCFSVDFINKKVQELSSGWSFETSHSRNLLN